MTIYFRGGELRQKGRGVGGFFRGLASIFKPIVQSVGTTAIKAAKSKTARQIASSLAEQALDSSLNMTKDLIRGGDLKQSLEHERQAFKNVGVDIIQNLQNRKRKKTSIKRAPKKMKKQTTLKSMKRYG